MKPFLLIMALSGVLLAALYTCPMHPHIVSEHEGSCPICGMDLVPTERTKAEETQGVTIDARRLQNAGVRTETITYTPFGRMIEAYGIVERDEGSVARLSVRVAGWISAPSVYARGERVVKGQKIAELYAPELIKAQNDYLLSLQNGYAEASAAKRLEALGMQQAQIEQLKKSGKPFERLPLLAMRSGVVASAMLVDGAYVMPGTTLLELFDDARVWVRGYVRQSERVYLEPSTPVSIVQSDLGNLRHEGRIELFDPQVDPKTNRATLRIALENPRGLLGIGSYVTLHFQSDADHRLSVPQSALLFDRSGSYVMVAQGDGRFGARRVRTGFSQAGRIEIVSGLDEGEAVVVNGAFLIDSESALHNAFEAYEGGGDDHAHH